jgi:hypothetical protein
MNPMIFPEHMPVGALVGPQEDFERWHREEAKALRASPNWLTTLPDCPCSIDHKKGPPGSWTKDPQWTVNRYHPGAACCWRTGAGPRQQCCFDKTGRLIRRGPAAGTPDRKGNLLEHYVWDVFPFESAEELDRGDPLGPYKRKYWSVRPPNGGRCR